MNKESKANQKKEAHTHKSYSAQNIYTHHILYVAIAMRGKYFFQRETIFRYRNKFQIFQPNVNQTTGFAFFSIACCVCVCKSATKYKVNVLLLRAFSTFFSSSSFSLYIVDVCMDLIPSCLPACLYVCARVFVYMYKHLSVLMRLFILLFSNSVWYISMLELCVKSTLLMM